MDAYLPINLKTKKHNEVIKKEKEKKGFHLGSKSPAFK